ncbi:hypothetical protein AUC70_12170 [Methyloceanibacter stevinii]|uniref:DUF4268 domain-containing protein n=1 Tax=Methyloceanibacter stevinii TaxID=1774970 RepID=A0A1E3VJB6_9HYPH|nr:hypothetical protein [Methyloceanibacter stevinii]ODR93604.1 hypothetical protein AUC70_12170 [Methyloceanibacter stevinii]
MAESLFLFDSDNVLKKIESSDFVTEDEFQRLLAQFPDLLTDADLGEGSPRRWMLVTREAPVADSLEGSGRWALDHLFLDQDAVPTLVEVKRASDTRARREVVAQMLDYAANAVNWWKVDELQRLFEKSCDEAGTTQDERLSQLLNSSEPDLEAFWRSVQSNLNSGRIRLIFVADRIPSELATIIEFLNEQMQSATVLAVELRHFFNGAERILAPRLIGLTQKATARRSIVVPARSVDDWMSDVLSATANTESAVRKFIDMMNDLGASTAVAQKSLALECGPTRLRVAYIGADGRVAVSLFQLAKSHVFASEASRLALLQRLDEADLSPSTRTLHGEPALTLPSVTNEEKWIVLRNIFEGVCKDLTNQQVTE